MTSHPDAGWFKNSIYSLKYLPFKMKPNLALVRESLRRDLAELQEVGEVLDVGAPLVQRVQVEQHVFTRGRVGLLFQFFLK